MSVRSSVFGVLLATSITLSGCTSDQRSEGVAPGSKSAIPPSEGHRQDFIAGGSIRLPSSWSFDFSRQGAKSWHFSFSPEPFTSGDPCKRQTGALSEEALAREEVFVTGFALPTNDSKAGRRYMQSVGDFVLDEGTLAGYETLGCYPTYRIDFELNDYSFTVNVAVSDVARTATLKRVREVLNSIE